MAYQSNGDKILQSVISDERLIRKYEYNPSDIDSLSDALKSDNVIIRAIAMIIDGNEQQEPERPLYNEVDNFLINHIV